VRLCDARTFFWLITRKIWGAARTHLLSFSFSISSSDIINNIKRKPREKIPVWEKIGESVVQLFLLSYSSIMQLQVAL